MGFWIMQMKNNTIQKIINFLSQFMCTIYNNVAPILHLFLWEIN